MKKSKFAKRLYATMTVLSILVASWMLYNWHESTSGLLAAFMVVCMAIAFVILFGMACQDIEEMEKARKLWNTFGHPYKRCLMQMYFSGRPMESITDKEILSIYKLETQNKKP